MVQVSTAGAANDEPTPLREDPLNGASDVRFRAAGTVVVVVVVEVVVVDVGDGVKVGVDVGDVVEVEPPSAAFVTVGVTGAELAAPATPPAANNDTATAALPARKLQRPPWRSAPGRCFGFEATFIVCCSLFFGRTESIFEDAGSLHDRKGNFMRLLLPETDG